MGIVVPNSGSPPISEPSATADSTGSAPRRRLPRPVRFLLIYVLVPYLGVCAVLAFLQRSLIYVPTKESAPLQPEDAGLADGRVETIHVKTDDGLVLNGWHVRPEAPADDGEPSWLVLYFHGNAGNRRLRVRDCTDFTDVGVDVFLFDYRGYGDNPGRPAEEPIASDARAIWRFATEERGVPADRILLYGESLGGAVAIRLASELCREGTPPAGLITSSTFSSLPDAAAGLYPFLPVRLLLVDRYPSVRRIGDVTCPIVMVHGDADTIVPIELGRHLFAAAPERSAEGIENRFVEYPDHGHNDIAKSEFAGLVRELLDELQPARP